MLGIAGSNLYESAHQSTCKLLQSISISFAIVECMTNEGAAYDQCEKVQEYRDLR